MLLGFAVAWTGGGGGAVFYVPHAHTDTGPPALDPYPPGMTSASVHDFENLDFVTDVDGDYICCVCFSLLSQPRSGCVEGHLACEKCFRQWLETQPTCPACRLPVAQLTRNRHAENYINELAVRCTPKDWAGDCKRDGGPPSCTVVGQAVGQKGARCALCEKSWLFSTRFPSMATATAVTIPYTGPLGFLLSPKNSDEELRRMSFPLPL